jgi:hypothetical protein
MSTFSDNFNSKSPIEQKKCKGENCFFNPRLTSTQPDAKKSWKKKRGKRKKRKSGIYR